VRSPRRASYHTDELSCKLISATSFLLTCHFHCQTWYLNRVIKSEFGQRLPLLFPFMRSYWCPRTAHRDVAASSMLDGELRASIPFEVFDRRQGDAEDDIEIHNLRKTFEKKHAVDGLSLTVYNGQVTALLGHNGKFAFVSWFCIWSILVYKALTHSNVVVFRPLPQGAGKTTTIKLLIGAISPSSGYATIAGQNILGEMQKIREDIGICPQENCLFDVLTVRETVQFFSRLKGVYSQMSCEEAEEHVDQAIQDIALSEKRNTLAKNLSGGMKRKLSVAVAFCGGSKTVFLDEPTSGM
jgi:ATP-binding cassette subfamily A (ABC1) protein 3